MAVYLVDFENVSSAGISGIQKLTKEDKVYIFYTVNASNMSFAAHLNLLSSPAEVVYYNVASGGKNALDFQLASFLGYLICQGKEKKFCIISNDRGFEYVKTFWERNGVAADISIFGAPSINRSLLAAEKPFAARIQQNVTAPAVQTAAETPAADEDKTASSENTETAKIAETVSEAAEAEQSAEKPAPKRRGRPRNAAKKSAENAEKKKKSAEKAETLPMPPSIASTDDFASETAESFRTAIAQNAETAKKEPKKQSAKQTDKQAKRSPKSTAKPQSEKQPAKKQQGNAKPAEGGEIPANLKTALSKAGVIDDAEIRNVLGLLKSSEGKQQFYRGILKFFGMERGVEIYKAVRPEYTNLTKLVKQ
ncbi:MAG: hypothetical protein K2J11_11375 [Oscillospiraceae bacterium]|nr:hypothetical protein [Oscillospiraceae bacterium]